MQKSFIILLLITFTSCYQVERECKSFKTGEFYSEVTIGDTIYKTGFIRTENLQIEVFNDKVDSSEVRWINDCEAVFKTINPKSMIEKKDIHLKILNTIDSTSYTFEYSYVGEAKKQRGTATRVESILDY